MRGSETDSDRAITPVAEALCVPAHLAPLGSLQAKKPCHLHTQLAGAELTQAEKVLHLCAQGHFGCVRLCDSVDRGGGSLGKNTGAYWPILVAIPF